MGKYLTFNHSKLKQLMYKAFAERNLNHESAHHATESMINTSLRGVDSHGINLFPHYIRAIEGGRINKAPNFQFNSASTSAFVLDADDAIGHHAGIIAMNKCIDAASNSGIAICSVKNSSHFGAAAYFGLHAANKGLIGLSFTNADALVKAYNGKKAFFGTNPICICAPLENEDPFCLDMATSLVSWNKVKNYRRENKDLPKHWAYNSKGDSTTDPFEARSLSPAGEYKGFGLGMMVEIFCSVLSGASGSNEMMAMFNTPLDQARNVGHCMMAIDINKMIPLNIFKSNLQRLVDNLRKVPALDDDPVMSPGDPEKKVYARRVNDGIPVLEEVYKEYSEVNNEFSKALI